jgi:uncharacterized protein YecE (DUF72 family)
VTTVRIRVGCSGWQYRHWRGRFYPAGLPAEAWLAFYAERFDSVELNNSFYRLPDGRQFARWRARLPPDFIMSVKASRYLTHQRKLRDPKEPLRRLWSRAELLGDRLGPMLYQLPPHWHRNVDRLAAFVTQLPPDHQHAIEFRDPSWYHPTVYQILQDARVALCLHDMAGSASPTEPIGPFVYIRFHGSGARYGGGYSPQRLTTWAERLARWAHAGLPAYAYFNNDAEGHAVDDAQRLRDLLARRRIA